MADADPTAGAAVLLPGDVPHSFADYSNDELRTYRDKAEQLDRNADHFGWGATAVALNEVLRLRKAISDEAWWNHDVTSKDD